MAEAKFFEIDGLRAAIIEHPSLGHLCGYLGVPPGHRLHGTHYDDEAVPGDVHGGWTYSDMNAPMGREDGWWYFGFDCAHFGDFVPGAGREIRDGEVYRDEQYVTAELLRAAPSLK